MDLEVHLIQNNAAHLSVNSRQRLPGKEHRVHQFISGPMYLFKYLLRFSYEVNRFF